jgi:gas vesicle protein
MRAPRAIITSLAAAALGAGVALLFAPQSGARTRRQIGRKVKNLVENLREHRPAPAPLQPHFPCETGIQA